jgi:hypothetical protein
MKSDITHADFPDFPGLLLPLCGQSFRIDDWILVKEWTDEEPICKKCLAILEKRGRVENG